MIDPTTPESWRRGKSLYYEVPAECFVKPPVFEMVAGRGNCGRMPKSRSNRDPASKTGNLARRPPLQDFEGLRQRV
jgi:hypothetical protein